MSTNPDLVNVFSRWLAGHVSDEELQAALDAVDSSQLTQDQNELIDEVRAELAGANGRGQLQRAVREALEALALG